MFAHSWISSVQFKTEVQLFRLRIAVKAIFLVHFCPSSLVSNQYTIDLPRFQSNIPSICLVSNQIYHRSSSFPIKYIIESMVYCSHLPNMVSARWLWRINILNEYRLFNRELKLGWRRRHWNVAKKINLRPFQFYRVYLEAVWTLSICQMKAITPGVWLSRTLSRFKKREENSSSYAPVLHKTSHSGGFTS